MELQRGLMERAGSSNDRWCTVRAVAGSAAATAATAGGAAGGAGGC